MTCALLRYEQTEKMTRQIDLKHLNYTMAGITRTFFFRLVWANTNGHGIAILLATDEDYIQLLGMPSIDDVQI
jgi:hypothetical protein